MTLSGAPLPADEARRLLDLARYQILDTAPEVEFDRITRLAARVLGVPVAVLNLVDQYRQWGKAAHGLGSSEAPRQDSFCAWTILGDGPFVVEDAQRDPRFRRNPMVTGEPHVRMYAGAPLVTPAGHRIGTLCVTDSQPHPLSGADLEALQDLAAVAMQLLELRRQALDARRSAEAQECQAQELRRTLGQARVLEGVSSLMELDLGPEQATLAAAALIGEAIDAEAAALIRWAPGAPPTFQPAYRRPGLVADPTGAGLNGADAAEADADWAAFLPQGGGTWSPRTLETPLYLDAPIPDAARPADVQAAWVPLAGGGDATWLLLFVRSAGHPACRWRPGDRALLEAAGRTIRHGWEQRAALEEARRQARHDALTGLPNRRAFDEALEGSSQPFTLALVDLDGLKAVNDREGHAQGDMLLRIFGAGLAAGAGEGGSAYRLGGDEFALLLPPQDEAAVLGRVEGAMNAARGVSAQRTGASTGVAQSHEAPGAADLLRLADERMYAVKRRRRELEGKPEKSQTQKTQTQEASPPAAPALR